MGKKYSLLKDVGEFGLIDLLRRQIGALPASIRGIGDDTAVLPLTKTKKLLLTADMLVEGKHFSSKTDPRLIGRKALAVSISDIAAMGGQPKYAVVSLGVSPKKKTAFIKDVYQGLKTVARKYQCHIVGGDTVASKTLIINIALTGEVRAKDLCLRSGSKPGDQIFVTGPLGRSLSSGHHLKFSPRLKESQWLVKNVKPRAMIDVSDGLASDLSHLLKAAGAGARLYQSQIPLRKGARIENALYDGEDFELLLTLSPENARKLIKQRRFIHIGEMTKEKGSFLINDGKKKKISVRSPHHF